MWSRHAASSGLGKPFKDIPGPSTWPLLGSLPHYLLTKKYDFEYLHRAGLDKFNEFGPIVREEFSSDNHVVWLFKPEDIQRMYELEGQYPARRSHLALEKYRLDNPHVYNNGGLLPTNGPAWARMRQAFQPLLKPQAVESFRPQTKSLCRAFTALLDDQPDVPDLLEELKKFFLELTVYYFLHQRLGGLVSDLDPQSQASRLMEAAMNTNENVLRTDNGIPLWRWFNTREYRAIRDGQATIEAVALEAIRSGSFHHEGLDPKDATSFVADMLLAGIDTSAYSMAFLLYHVARNPDVQAQLHAHAFDEASGLRSYSYGKRTLQESLRLNPISIGNARILPEDGIFSGYRVPAGTCLVSQNLVACRFEANFDQASEFRPQRWERTHRKQYHPYLSLPFGFGKRMCIGRRLAEQGMLMLLNSLVGRYHLEWAGQGELDIRTKLINKPDRACAFRLTHR